MAKIGLEYVVVGVLNAETTESKATAKYSNGRYLGPSSSLNGSPNTSDVQDYGDDRAVESDTSVTGGTLSLELNEDALEVSSMMLGHAYDSESGEMVSNSEDIAPYVGIGCVGKSMRNGQKIFTGKFYFKVQFREPNDENATRQETTTFNHTTYEGNIYMLDNGDWKVSKEFKNLADAKAWLDLKIGVESPAAYLLDGVLLMDGAVSMEYE